ncbi:MAG: type IV secretory system conjugative DNA transfer family protein [Bacteroidetes bacterium]|nr:type IV secretory system conjugative DNA transfer family protein [Bacteroidota bacterium]
MTAAQNEQPLNRILDVTRVISLLILLSHFFYFCQAAFVEWNLTGLITNRFLDVLEKMGLFISFGTSKWIALGVLLLSLIGTKGKKIEKLGPVIPGVLVLFGLLFYFGSVIVFDVQLSNGKTTISYIALTLTGYLLFLAGGAMFSRILRQRIRRDIFNTLNESFPQEHRSLVNGNSINLPYAYQYNGRKQTGWINILDPMRGLLVMGSPGSGKSWYIVQNLIKQQIQKGYTMFLFDFKYNDLTLLAYNYFLRYRKDYPVQPKFYVISFDDLEHSHRCNPLDVSGMTDIADATEAARSILLGLNTEWISKQGDFWVESAITFATALIWFLRKYAGGKYCTLPHVIELMQIDYGRLLSVLRSEPQIQNYIGSFVSAYMNNNIETLDNQLTSLKIGIARLSSPTLYYIMTGNDFTLDINDPKAPKICCIGSSPQRSGIYGAVISLYTNTMNRLVNKKGMLKSSHMYDEFSSIYVHRVNETIATARSNKVAVTIIVQDASQLRLNYGKEQAEVILNLPANRIFGQVANDSAEMASKMIGKNVQARSSIQTNRAETSFSISEQLDMAIPASRISMLSSGEFAGVVADTPDQQMEYKAFHGKIIQDNKKLNNEQSKFKGLPVIRKVVPADIQRNYEGVKRDIENIVESELKRMRNTPGLASLVIVKKY